MSRSRMRWYGSARRLALLAAAALAASALVGSGPTVAQAETANSGEPAVQPSAAQSEVDAAAAQARATGQPVEIESLRTATTTTFVRPDGLMRLDQAPAVDTYVASAKPTESYGDDERLVTGVAPNLKSKYRSYLAFATPTVPAGARLMAAHLRVFQQSAVTCTPTELTAVPMTESWTTAMTWAAQPDYSTTSEYAAAASFAHGRNGCQDDFDVIDVTKMVSVWHAGTVANHGLALRADEADATAYKALCSVDASAAPKGQPCATAGRGPVLSVTYNQTPAEPRGRSVTPCAVDCLGAGDLSAVTTSTSPVLAGSASDADGGLLQYDFEVWKGNVTADVDSYPDTACGTTQAHAGLVAAARTVDSYQSSQSGSWTVPAGSLTDGAAYVYRVRAFDGVACGPWSTGTGGWARFSVGDANALRHKAIATLDTWVGWLADNNVRGYVGEVGWPNQHQAKGDWSGLAHAWYGRAESHGLPVTTWVTGEWAGGHPLANYVSAGSHLSAGWTTTDASSVMEAHPGTTAIPHGVNITGPEMGSPSDCDVHPFSNVNVGQRNERIASTRSFTGGTYHYDIETHDDPANSTMRYLAGRGVRVVRIPFRWERMQRTPYGDLDAAELDYLRTMVRVAGEAGLKVVLDMHNYGGYYLHDLATGQGIRRTIGSAELPNDAFADVWTKLATAFANEPAIWALGLMNEPIATRPNCTSPGDPLPPAAPVTVSDAQQWEGASQAAVTAIRATGEQRTIMVGGFGWSGMKNWAALHPVAWIDDPTGNVMYEAHQYWDRSNSGIYQTYAEELAATEAQGW